MIVNVPAGSALFDLAGRRARRCDNFLMDASDMPPLGRIAIVGAGALGSLIAARLADFEIPVVLINRPSPHLDLIRGDGLRLIEQDGSERRIRVPVASDPAAIAECAVAIVAVKTWATEAALRSLVDWLPRSIWVATLQNGIDNDARIRAALGPDVRLALGTTSLGATRQEPGVVRSGGTGPTLFGVPSQAPPAELRALGARFAAVGMPAAAIAGIEQAIWRKLAVSAAINGLTALAEAPNGAIVDDPELRAASFAIAREVESVAHAEGNDIGDVERAVCAVARATATNRSSMWQDLEAGNPTEVEAIYGAIVARAARHGIDVPAIRTVAAILRARSRADEKERS